MKRGIALALLSFILIMCKTKDALPKDQLTNFVVILEGNSTPNVLKKDISFDLNDSQKFHPTKNQWNLNYVVASKSSDKLRSQLLNHPKVIGVYTEEQMKKYNSKNDKESNSGSSVRKRVSKQ